MKQHARFFQGNLSRWNELVAIHAASEFYDVTGFKAGKTALMPLEREELGDVQGKSLLHLQCHFGLDTLSWARLGAEATGIDFSPEAIETARRLSAECAIPARFLCANIYDLPQHLAGQFDVVFTSYGALCWLPDLPEWGRIVAHFLKPGGTFYVVETHPLGLVFDDRGATADPRLGYPYFSTGEPLELVQEKTYTDGDAVIQNVMEYSWIYTLGDVLNALIGAGLTIRFLHEFPFHVCKILPHMEKCPDGWWRFTDPTISLPLLFSVKATKS